MRRPCAFSSALFLLLVTSPVLAQDVPQSTVGPAPASKGATDITSQKFEAATAPPDPEKAKDATELSIGAGGLASSGNARLISLTANADFRVRRIDDQLTAALAANYGRTATPGKPLETSVENIQGRTRYDRFFATDWTAFLGVQARHDRFQGLDLRLQIDPGIGYYFIDEPKHLLWAEVGYDYLHDIRRDEDRVVLDAMGMPTGMILDKTSSVHSARAFLGYSNQVNEAVTASFGLEYLQGLSDTGIRRFNAEAKLSSKLAGKLSVAMSFLLRYDNSPLPGKEKVDTTTALNLVYKLL